jgi:hypothetical protein
MTDLSKLSDAELERLAKAPCTSQQFAWMIARIPFMSDEELERVAAGEWPT